VAAITIEGLSKRYPTGTQALDGIELAVADAEFVALVGPSGCGKSTLLRIMAGLDEASSGTVTITPRVVASSNAPGIGGAGGGAVFNALPSAMVFQEPALFPWMRVAENVAFAFDRLQLSASEVRRRVDTMLERVGLTAFAHAFPHELSGGMRQRVAVARAFAVDAPVLFMDEPFAALDEQTRVRMAGELGALWERERRTVVFVTHGIEEAVTLADRIVVMSARPGRVRAIVPVDLPRPRDPIALRGTPAFAALVLRIWELLA
jgi:NitT/TauT family transport system ATP-binding protein